MPVLDRNAADLLIDQRRSAHHFVSSFLHGLDPEAQFSARSVLAAHPEVAGAKSAVLDLALEDFCRREAAGETPDAVAFANQFPTHVSSILRLLQLRDYFEANNELFALKAPAWPELGDHLLGFVLLDELGRGACARVYLAIQIDIGERLVVLKLSPNHAAETEALGRLIHPNIVPIHSVARDEERGLSVLCMPYLGLATLFDVVSSNQTDNRVPERTTKLRELLAESESRYPAPTRNAVRFPERYVDFVAEIAEQMAAALEYTHAQGFCHFDIKPTNVLLGSDGVVRLIDFNLAAASSRQQSAGGTVPYMSPEQLRRHLKPGSLAEEGPPSDIFSLGVVLYELLTGRYPFREFPAGEDRRSAAADLLKCQPQARLSLRELNPAVDHSLESLVQRCLRIDPAARPTARELRAQLAKLRSWRQRTLRWLRHRRRQIQWAAMVIAAIVAGSATWMATRTPQSAALVQRADHDMQRGDFASAETKLTQSIELDPSPALSWFARGQCRLALRNFEDAAHDFRGAYHRNTEPRAAAYAGYCLCQSRPNWQEAIQLLQEARDWGADGPGLLTDLAYCHLMLRQLSKAEERLAECMPSQEAPPQTYHVAAKINRELALEALNSGDQTESIRRLELSRACLEQAIETGYETAELHLDCAWTEGLLSWETNEPAARAIGKINHAVNNAIRLNCDPAKVDDLRLFFPQWANQIQQAPAIAEVNSEIPVVDPFWPNPLISPRQ